MKISESVVETIKSPELGNVTIDLAETVLDGVIKGGIIEEIPILSALFGIRKGTLSIADKLFAKKLMYFIFEQREISFEERNKQLHRIQTSSKYKTKVGEKILMIIDQCGDTEKATLIGVLFHHCLKNELEYSDFIKCVEIINKVSLVSLLDVVENDFTEIPIDQEDDLISSGMFALHPPKIELVKYENTHAHVRDGEDLRTRYEIRDVEWSAVLTKTGGLIRSFLVSHVANST